MTLDERAKKVRQAVSSGDFQMAHAALAAYCADLKTAVRSGVATRTAEEDWNEIVRWVRGMALTARELAREELATISASALYRNEKGRSPSLIDTRG